jgi:hypothetical protein
MTVKQLVKSGGPSPRTNFWNRPVARRCHASTLVVVMRTSRQFAEVHWHQQRLSGTGRCGYPQRDSGLITNQSSEGPGYRIARQRRIRPIVGVASPTIPSWNQLVPFLETMRQLQKSGQFVA